MQVQAEYIKLPEIEKEFHFVERAWLFLSETPGANITDGTIVPNGLPKIIIPVFCDDAVIKYDNKCYSIKNSILFTGILKKAVQVRFTGRLIVVGVELNLMTTPKHPSLNFKCLGSSIKQVCHTFPQTSDPGCSHNIQQFVISYLRNNFTLYDADTNVFTKAMHPALKHIYNEIIRNEGAVKCSEIAQKFGYTNRYIHMLFSDEFGISPKQYSEIVRFKCIYKKLLLNNIKQKKNDYYEIFYDQSHFIKNCRKYAAHTPGELFRNKNDIGKGYILAL